MKSRKNEYLEITSSLYSIVYGLLDQNLLYLTTGTAYPVFLILASRACLYGEPARNALCGDAGGFDFMSHY